MLVEMVADLGVGEERPRDVGDDGLCGHSSKCWDRCGQETGEMGAPAQDGTDLRREATRGGGWPGRRGRSWQGERWLEPVISDVMYATSGFCKSQWSLRTEQTTLDPPPGRRLSDSSHLLPLGLPRTSSKMPPKNKGKKGKKGGDDDEAFWCVHTPLHPVAPPYSPGSHR